MKNISNVLKLTTFGIKNIDKPISLYFSNKTIEKGIKKLTKVKGVFGYNGSGKTALMTSVLLYKKIVTDDRYLLQDVTTSKLKKLLNKKIQEFSFEVVFKIEEKIVRHKIVLCFDSLENGYAIKNESIDVCKGRTLEENWERIVSSNDGIVTFPNKIKPDPNSEFDNFFKARFRFCSIVVSFAKFFASMSKKEGKQTLFGGRNKELSLLLFSLFLSVLDTKVFLRDEDKHDSYFLDVKNTLSFIEKHVGFLKSPDFCEDYIGSETVRKENITNYESKISRAAKFVKLFKPSLQKINLEKKENEEFYQVNKVFEYRDYSVDFEFESSGIKHLISMFDALEACANGSIVFIDEMDANINSVYFRKLIEFFQKYGEGQLCFTSHDLLVMTSLKKQGKSITFLGEDCEVDDWASFGNRSPINDYQNGFISHSPMNIEDFDFIPIFFPEGEK